MKIIIDVKDTVALSRIVEFSHHLDNLTRMGGFPDVIEKISKEW